MSRTPPDIKRKRQKEKDAKMEEIVILQLAPFSAHAVVMFEDIKLGDSAVRKLAIRNPKSTQTKVINHIYIHNFTKLFKKIDLLYVYTSKSLTFTLDTLIGFFKTSL